MDTDNEIAVPASGEGKLLFGEETRRIIGCAMSVLNEIGHGFCEKIYENALCYEFALNGIPFAQQKAFPVFYKKRMVGKFVPDLVVFDKIIVDAKCVSAFCAEERAQILNYLRATGLRVGMLLNFKNPRLSWERIVL